MPKKRSLWSLGTLLLVVGARAQGVGDGWLLGSFNGQSGLFVIGADRATVTMPQPQSVGMQSSNAVAASGGGLYWYSTLPTATTLGNEIFLLIATPTQVVLELQLTNGPVGSLGSRFREVTAIVRRADEIWYCTADGEIGFVDAFAGNQTHTVVFQLPMPVVTGFLNAMATDGREMYLGLYGAPAGPNVLALDVSAAPPVLRPVADTRPVAVGGIVALSLGPDGSLLVIDQLGVLVRIDPVTGAVALAGQPIYPSANAGGYHPWSGLLAVASGPTTNMPVDFLHLASQTWRGSLQLNRSSWPTGLVAACEQPFELFGRGCPAAGSEPRLRWTGLPVRGRSAVVTLRRAPPGALALLLLGMSRTSSVFGALPIDGQAFGAPGCSLLVSPDASAPALVAPAGTAQQALAVPNSAALAGAVVFGQWAIVTPANALGVVTTEAVTLRVR